MPPFIPAGSSLTGVRYGHPKRLILAVIGSVLAGRPRSLRADAAWLVSQAPVRPNIENADLIPADRPFVVVANHYDRTDMGAWWGPILACHAIARHRPAGHGEIRWGMAARWVYPPGDRWGRWVMEPLTARLFPRLTQIYGLIPMPPVPPRPDEVAARAQAVRQFLNLARDPEVLLGLALEGQGGSHAQLVSPPPGAGRFMLQFGKLGRPILPAGLFERNGILTVAFGPPFILSLPAGIKAGPLSADTRADLDRLLSTQVMVAIGRCLPPPLWGEYQTEIEADLAARPA